MHSDFQTFRFVLLISIFSALLLSLTATSLKNKQDLNIEVDRKKNVLKCAGIDVSKLKSEEIIKNYKNSIVEKVIAISGEVVDISYQDLTIEENKSTGQITYYNTNTDNLESSIDKIKYLPLFEYSIDGIVDAYIIPISGKGLWSTLYGYFSLSKDLESVLGITFYKHGETPGLGGEIEKKWFQEQFKDKKIFDEKKSLVSITVVKGKASGKNINYQVDGISGATITGNGVTNFLKADLLRYLPFIKQKQSTIINTQEIGV